MEDRQQAERIVRRLMAAIRCTVCGSHYESDRIKFLGCRDEIWFLTVTCSRCHTQGLVAALLKDAEGSSVALTRISVPGRAVPREVVAEQEGDSLSGPITQEDVAGIRLFLQEFDGDFARLFGAGQR